jgi:hypothetical protein
MLKYLVVVATIVLGFGAQAARAQTTGYSLDTASPHVTLLQRHVRTADLPKVYAAVQKMKAQVLDAQQEFIGAIAPYTGKTGTAQPKRITTRTLPAALLRWHL